MNEITHEPKTTAAEFRRIADELAGLDDGSDPFVAAVRATRMPMIITNPRLPDNPVVFANNAFCRLSGYDRSEIVGRNCRFLQGAETDPKAVRRIHDAVKAVRSIEIDIRNHRKNGEPFWNRLLMAPVFDSQGEHAYFFASQVDVTVEREKLEGLQTTNAALAAELTSRLHIHQEREREFQFAMRAGRFGTWGLDLKTWELTSSDACKTLFGLKESDAFSYKTRLSLIHPDDRAESHTAIERSSATGENYDVIYRVVHASGDIRWLASRGQPFMAADGTPLRLAGVTSDITDAYRAARMRDALVALADTFREIEDPADISYAAAEILGKTLDVSRAGYGLIDPVAETVTIERDWNAPGITSLAGVLHFRDFGSYVEDLKRGDDVVISDVRADPRTAVDPSALEAISARAFLNMPLTEHGGLVALLYLNHATQRPWREDELAFIREAAERTLIATERRRAEIDLAALAASLERQVEARTDELLTAEAALRQSQKMEAVGQLTGGLAHDFNNLLTGITGSLELLQTRMRQGRFNDIERYVAAAQGAAQRAAALTHRLLAFSRQQTLDPKSTDLNRLVAGMQDLIQRTVGPGIAVEAVGAGGLWNTLVDPGQLENALLNLCINARDAMPHGGKITIETSNRWLDERGARERELPPGQYVSMCVSDTGTGMPPDVIARAFDPFFTTKPIGQGTGLGLSMVYGFARQSGGQVRIYSEVGDGTMVCLYLPRHRGSETDEDISGQLSEAPRAKAGETVLVVDDEPTIRMLVAEVLEELGYTAIEAVDGASGLKVLQSDARIDLLVTDVGLPNGMNGRQVADAARVLRPKLKVLFITGYAENAVLNHGHLDPGMHVLTKPFAMEALASRVKDLIAGERREA